MLARIHKAMRNKDEDQGFTLIELLVVMIIIGILAAIAIPVFLNQRKKAVDASIKSDLRTVAAEMETYFTDTQTYNFTTASTATVRTVTISPAVAAVVGPPAVAAIPATTVTVSAGNVITAKALTSATAVDAAPWTGTTQGYCLQGVNSKASNPTTGFYYNSLSGGFTTTACP
jgi:type IV pilus assembly protein PilA